MRANVLGAALVQLTMPGVPDLYQGTESEYLALVDPDNRRPFRRPEGPAEEKQVMTAAALGLRRELPEVFGESGTYVPLEARGPAAGHVVAFSRSGEVAVAVTRLSLRLAEGGGGGTRWWSCRTRGRGAMCWSLERGGSSRGVRWRRPSCSVSGRWRCCGGCGGEAGAGVIPRPAVRGPRPAARRGWCPYRTA